MLEAELQLRKAFLIYSAHPITSISFVTCPTELIKIRQQALIDSRPTVRQVALDVVRENGPSGLYRGMTVTLIRDLGYGAYFLAVSQLHLMKKKCFYDEHFLV